MFVSNGFLAFDKNLNLTGTYEICLDNKPALVAKKLVHFYLMTVVEHEWHEFREELESIELRFHNFAVSACT